MRTKPFVTMFLAMLGAAMPGCLAPERTAPCDPTANATDALAAPQVAERIIAGEWVGHAISYSGYRAGQHPDGGPAPSKAEILEDLRIIEKHWSLIRVYGSDRYTEDVLEVIRDEHIDLKVMLGIWLGKEPGNEAVNAAQVDEGIRLANAFADIIFAVNVGNEVLIYWTAHPVPEDAVVAYIQRVKAHVPMPVTLADNYAWWVSDGARIADEVDFLTVHTYPAWERKSIDQGMRFTLANIESVRAALPGKSIMIGEAGWPSYTEGNLHVPQTGNEVNQKRYHEELTAWAKANGITVFFFSAFDEPWKGTGTEGHWGFFTVDRKAKLVAREWYPELVTDQPTSPAYTERPDTPQHALFEAGFRKSLVEQLTQATANLHGAGVNRDRSGVAAESAAGDGSLRVAFNGADWGGVYFLFGGHDVSAAQALVLRAKLPPMTKFLELKVEGPEGNGQTLELMDFLTGTDADGWGTFTVPLAAFGQVDFKQLTVIGLWNPEDASDTYVKGDLLLDDVHFE